MGPDSQAIYLCRIYRSLRHQQDVSTSNLSRSMSGLGLSIPQTLDDFCALTLHVY